MQDFTVRSTNTTSCTRERRVIRGPSKSLRPLPSRKWRLNHLRKRIIANTKSTVERQTEAQKERVERKRNESEG